MQIRKHNYLLLLVLALLGSQSIAGGPAHKPAVPPHIHDETVKFIENKGQWYPKVNFAADLVNGRLFLENTTLTYTFGDLEGFHDRFFFRQETRDVPVPVEFHAFKAHLRGASAPSEIVRNAREEQVNNYFLGNDPSKWASNVPLFRELIYREVYPGIDMGFFGREKSLKYEFYVDPGVDPGQIAIEYEGLSDIFLQDGQLHLVTTVNEVVEMQPVAWQNGKDGREDLAVTFRLEGSTVTFDFPEGYDKNKEIVIDPTLIFSTYTGSTADNFGYTATYDDNGNLYAGGVVFGIGYPFTTGAFLTTFQGGGTGGAWSFSGGVDISISKINPAGTGYVYSTYVGGSDNEQPHSLVTNSNGDLYIYGISWSTDYPMGGSPAQATLQGGSDIIVTCLNNTGSGLVGSTYIGGTSDDGMNVTTAFSANSLKFNYGDDARGEIILDDLGNPYVASCTQSNNFPVSGAYQSSFGGGNQDGVVFKMTPTLNAVTWATYHGGNGNDACYGIKVDSSYGAFVTGGTASSNFPVTTGALQTAYGGAIDGFISHITNNGGTLNSSTYIGTNLYDQSYFIELNAAEEVFVYGQTLGAWAVTPGKYNNPGGKQFVAKYTNDLTSNIWSTVFGSGSSTVNLSPTAFLVDVCGFIYMAGWGGAVNFSGSTTGMPITADAYQSTTDGSDVYLIVLVQEANGLEYGTYMGGTSSDEHVDGGTSRFNRNLEVYHAVCAGCGGNSDFPTFADAPGPISATNNSSNCNLAAFKFAFTPQYIIAAFSSATFDSCAPFPVSVTNTSSGGVDWWWDFGDGSPLDTNFNAYHLYQNPGTYTIKLVVSDTNSCNQKDSVINTVTVYPNPLVTVAGGADICNGGSTTLSAFGGDFFNWSPSTGLSSTNAQYPVASPNDTTTYTVIVTDTNGCVDTGFVTVNVTTFEADAGPPVAFCEGTGGAQLIAGAVNSPFTPYYYTWWCDSTNTYCGLDSVFDNDPIANPTQTTTYYLQVTDGNGCTSSVDSVVVEVLPTPIVDAGPDRYICPDSAPGAQLNPTITNAPGPYVYRWEPGTGINDSTILNPYARPDTTTIYTLVVESSNGCISDRTTVDTLSSVTVHVHPQPIAEAGPDRDLCLGDSLMLQGYGFGAGPNYNFEWSPYTGLNDTARTNPMASPPSTVDYILTVWSNGCPGSDTVTVNVHTLPTASAGPQTDICLGESTILQGSASGDSTATYSFEWMPAASLDDSSKAEPLATPDTTTTYYLIASSQYGCKSPADSVKIVVKSTPISEAGPQMQLCEGDSVQLNGSFFYTTTLPADPSQVYFAWTPGGGLLSDSTLADPWVAPTQSGFYYLQVRHNTCSTLDSVLVTVIPELGAWAEADTGIACEGLPVQLTSGGGIGNPMYQWIPAAGLSDPTISNPVASPDSSTNYLLVLSEAGCTDTIEVPLEIIPGPDIEAISSPTTGCSDLTVTFLDNSENVIFRTWDFGDGEISNTQNPSHTYSQPGTYVVTLSGVNTGGCVSTDSAFIVTVADPGSADFTSDPGIPAELPLPGSEVNFTDQSRGAVKWTWDFGDLRSATAQHPSHTYRQPGEYYVTLTTITADGCRSSVTKGPFTIFAPDLFIPNVFSPNSDGVNDEYLVQYSGDQPFSIEIYDRWGAQMFQSKDKLDGWKGLNKTGETVPEGVYYYRVQVGDKAYAGDVTLLR